MDEHVDAASPSESEKKLAEQNLQSLASEFAVTQEWGLCPAAADGSENQQEKVIRDYIKSAAAAIAANDLAGANDSTLAGRTILNGVQKASRYWFVANNRFGFLPLAMTAISGLLAYWVIIRWFLGLDVPRMLHHPIFFGWVGAILKSLYWLQFQINKGLLRPRWFTYFMI